MHSFVNFDKRVSIHCFMSCVFSSLVIRGNYFYKFECVLQYLSQYIQRIRYSIKYYLTFTIKDCSSIGPLFTEPPTVLLIPTFIKVNFGSSSFSWSTCHLATQFHRLLVQISSKNSQTQEVRNKFYQKRVADTTQTYLPYLFHHSTWQEQILYKDWKVEKRWWKKNKRECVVWNKNRTLCVSEFYKINHYVFQPWTLSNNNSAARGGHRAAAELIKKRKKTHFGIFNEREFGMAFVWQTLWKGP